MATATQPRLVVLDRDGVINEESPEFIKTPDEWRPLPGSLAAIAALTQSGFTVVVATNQSGIGRGLITESGLIAIHARMTKAVESAGGRIAGIFVCPHRPDENCECRKPKPGLLRQIEIRYGTPLSGQPVIGDSLRDIEAALAVGARAILVRTGNGSETERESTVSEVAAVFDDLMSAAQSLIAAEEFG